MPIPGYASNMTLIYLLRHAESAANREGVLAGRLPNIGLSPLGAKQARRLAESLQSLNVSKVYQSPLQRCRETIAPFLLLTKKRASIQEDFVEMDYGAWSGRKLSELRRESLWKAIQSRPSKVKFPNGESFLAASKRIKRGLNEISRRHPKGSVLVVSHGDPIKIAVQLALGYELDKFQKLVVDPGSITIIDWPSGTVLGVNLPASSIPKFSKADTKRSLKKRRTLGGGTNGTSHL